MKTLLAILLAPLLSAAPRQVTDMAGRQVTLPEHVHTVATLGAVPVLNSFLFALGEGDKLVNGLPLSFRSPRYRMQTRFAPRLADLPALQMAANAPSLEQLVALAPDVVLTMDRATADALGRHGVPTLVLSWQQPEDVKRLMRLLGDVLRKREAAEDYVRYFDETVARVAAPRAQRPRVLFCSYRRLTQDHLIAEWWIEAAGGISVTNNGRHAEAFAFSVEHILAWNPEVLVVADVDDVAAVRQDLRLRDVAAVRSGRVYVSPMGAHLWANRTAELPLMLLWAAKTFYPERFAGLDMVHEMQTFYSRFFHYAIPAEEAHQILENKFR